MTSRSLFTAILRASQAAERANRMAAREQERRRHRAAAEARRAQRQRELQLAHDSKEAKAHFDAASLREVELMNHSLTEHVEVLEHLLTNQLGAPVHLATDPDARRAAIFGSLRKLFEADPFYAEASIGAAPTHPQRADYETHLDEPRGLARLFGGRAKYQKALAAAKLHDDAVFARAEAEFRQRFQEWTARADRARVKHSEAEALRRHEIESHNAAIDATEAAFEQGDADAVAQYSLVIIDALQWPEDVPHEARVAYVPDSKHIIVEIVLPTVDAIPAVRDYSYVKSKREIRPRPRPRAEIQALYRSTLAGMTLRVLRELFGAVPSTVTDTITINGILDTINPATGEPTRPCIVSVRVTREDFSRLQLERVDPVACLATLGATVSKRPDELAPVRPVIEFDMVDRRFVEGDDVLDELDSRTNIMDLNPFQFEELVTNLFSKMGLDAKLTRSSRDGGVDCVAFDQRPILGGKVVVQAKRYKHTVGVSAVRDLFGTMMNEGANKGILVTTAGFGPDAYEFAKDKPIELIDGGGLLFLLEQNGVQARIIMPE